MVPLIRIALPNKGRLADDARELLERAGLELEFPGDRALQASLGGEFLAIFVRAQDIPEFVADGAADLGITGRDLIEESGRRLETLLDLGFGRCRLVVAAREDGEIGRLGDIATGAPVATSFPRVTKSFFEELGMEIDVVPVSGAAEIAPHIGVADVIADLTSTGSTLKMNGLKELATVMDSTAQLVVRPDVLLNTEAKREIRHFCAAIESVIRARGKRYLMANVPKRVLPAVKEILPGISGPTIVDVMDSGEHVAAHAVVDRGDVYRVISKLKELGAEGILVTKIERLMP